MDIVKQIIVIRSDLKNKDGQKIRTGKIISQACHASISFLTRRIQASQNGPIKLSRAEQHWTMNGFTKICVRVDNENELLTIHKKALAAGLQSHLITDAGKTEFDGVPTNTCLAIGPDYSEFIDPITGNLKLL